MQHLDFTRNPEVDTKIEFCKDISNMALIEMSVCLLLLLVFHFILKVFVCTIIASIGLVGSTIAFVVCTYKFKKLSGQLW